MNKKNAYDFLEENKGIIIISLIFLLFKFIFINKMALPFWDSAVYIGMGKYLYSLGQSGLWEIIRPIGMPLLTGLIWKLNLNVVFFTRAVVILLSSGNIILTYIIAKKIFNKNVALISAAILAITPLFLDFSGLILSGIPSTFFALLAIYFYLIKRNIFLTGIFSAITFLFRFPEGLILISILLVMLTRRRFLQNSLKLISGFLLITIPYFIFNYLLYRNEVSKVYHGLFRPLILAFPHSGNPTYLIPGFFNNIFFYITGLLKENLLLIFSLAGIYYYFKKKLYKNYKVNLIIFPIALFLLFFTYIGNKQLRFSLIFLPYLAILSAYGIYSLFNLIENKKIIKLGLYTFAIILGISFLMFLSFEYGGNLVFVGEEPKLSSEFYKYPVDNIEGIILTSDPGPVIYSNNQFIPIYFSIKVEEKELNEYRDKLSAIMYSPEATPCFGDEECLEKKESFFNTLQSDYNLVFHEQYFDKNYYIFLAEQ